jgi:IrrE N-terminal-like domain
VKLPYCSATQVLRGQFGTGSDMDLIEQWVSFVTGTADRTEMFGLRGINRIVRNYQIIYRPDNLLCYDGQLRLENDRMVMVIKPGFGGKRGRFTIAHELGHAAFCAVAPELNQTTRGVERLCDIFAAELMMPIRMVRELQKKYRHSEIVMALSRMTGASLSASCIRVNECLGLTSGLATLDGDLLENYGELPGGISASGELRAGVKAATDGHYRFVSATGWLFDVSLSRGIAVYTADRLSVPT